MSELDAEAFFVCIIYAEKQTGRKYQNAVLELRLLVTKDAVLAECAVKGRI